MKGKNIRRIRPQLTTGCMAMTFAVGFLTFTPVTSLASGGVNAITSIEQQQRISGTVKDAAGDPIIGASVVAKGVTANAVTDIDGRYSLQVAPGTVLEISYVGFKSQTVTVRNGVGTYDVTLVEDNQSLSEVVVVGYGTQKKANLSGSVAQIDGATLENRPISNVSSGLQGLMPGITVTASDGAPGMDGGTIMVRGVGTLNTATPYILIDGVEAGNLNSLDPEDIASISVLKDASSAAIYGSKASNGVILVHQAWSERCS